VRRAAVVEAGLDLDPEAHVAPDAEHAPDEPLPRRSRRRHRHEVLDLPDARLRQEPGDQDVRVREVELLYRRGTPHRCDPVVAAPVAVEDRAEDARRVEPGAAVPVDRPVGADERDRPQVADHPVLGNRQVGRRGRQRDFYRRFL
jgi:hypothetical protein